MSDEEPEVVALDEAEQIRIWRFTCALALGYGFVDSLAIAEDGTDLHALQELLNRGCPHELARQISTPI